VIQKLTSHGAGSSTPIKDAVSAGTIEKPIPINKGRSAALKLLLIALRSASTAHLLIRSRTLCSLFSSEEIIESANTVILKQGIHIRFVQLPPRGTP